MDTRICYVHFEDQGMGFKPTLCCRGTKHAHCVVNDETGVRVIKMPIRDTDKARPVLYRGQPYPFLRFKEAMLRIGRRKGITQAAIELLERPEAVSGDPPEDAVPAPKPDGATPEATKPVSARQARPDRPSGDGLIASFAVEFKLDPKRVRKVLRAAGLHAPYTDAAAIRKALTK